MENCKKKWWAVEGTAYMGRCKSLLCAEITLMFEVFLAVPPSSQAQVHHIHYISVPNTIPLEINVG